MKNQTEIACKMIQKKSTLNILNEKTKARNILHLFFLYIKTKILQQHENTIKSNNKINNYINHLSRLPLLKYTHTQKK